MRFDILTVFPEMIRPALSESILGRACEKGLIDIRLYNIRDYTTDRHRRTDDTPYGGGWGMVMTCQPLLDCYRSVVGDDKDHLTLYMSPGGKPLTQRMAKRFAAQKRLVILCGHYEGIDQRVIDAVVDEEVSIGDYVLTGGEMPAAVLVDCVSRLIPGVLPDAQCHEDESIESGLLEYPQYTKPAEYEGMRVPAVLLGGHHANIVRWRRRRAIEKTYYVRRDLLRGKKFSGEDAILLKSLRERDPGRAGGARKNAWKEALLRGAGDSGEAVKLPKQKKKPKCLAKAEGNAEAAVENGAGAGDKNEAGREKRHEKSERTE